MSLFNIALQNETREKTCFTTHNVMQVRNNSLIIYQRPDFHVESVKEILRENLKKSTGTYKGFMSDTAKKRMLKICDCWLNAINEFNSHINPANLNYSKRLVFVTLTLSAQQWHNDKVIKEKMLKPFLRILRERKGIKNYIWRAEKQENGNIHFHIIVDQYIDKFWLQKTWNHCQEKLFYISRYTKQTYKDNPPSTHIRAVDDYEAAKNYVTKYITKEEENGKIEGAVWKVSKALRTLQFYDTIVDSDTHEKILKAEKAGACTKVEKEFCFIYKFKNLDLNYFFSRTNRALYSIYLDVLSRHLYSSSDELNFKDRLKRQYHIHYNFADSVNDVCLDNYKEASKQFSKQLTLFNTSNYRSRFI